MDSLGKTLSEYCMITSTMGIKRFLEYLTDRGLRPTTHWIDNESSEDLNNLIGSNQ